MSYQTPITIRDAVERIRRSEFVLPAIQREFIWKPDQIARLFDSLMRRYPIGGFLFWEVDRDRCDDYKFYKFLDQYHERDKRHNDPFGTVDNVGVTAILDGQQRLTSLYIGLHGSYAYKTKHKRRNSPDAFPIRRLYLNLQDSRYEDDVDLKYDFRFLTKDEVKNEGTRWFLVGNVLKFQNLKDVINFLRDHNMLQDEYPQECLTGLYEAICEKNLVNYYRENDQDVEKVLNIFIRVNSGGTPLDYSDLLLSMATAQWKDVDAREAIHGLVDDLNRIGGGFNVSKDLVLKSCLVLSDISDIAYKVSNFTRDNTSLIQKQWPHISEALTLAVTLVSRFGYNGTTLTSYNALIPIAYYILARGNPTGYVERGEFRKERAVIRTWIARALLDRTFGGNSDTILRSARLAIQAASKRARVARKAASFPAKRLDTALGIRFQEEDLEDFLDLQYGYRTTFSVLALLYPNVDFANRFHTDHIFPRARFTEDLLRKSGVSPGKVQDFQDRKDRVANLQLLEGTINEEKSAKMPSEWLAELQTDERNGWLGRNFVEEMPEEMTGFLNFYKKRRKRMKKHLSKALGLSPKGRR